MRKLLFMVMLLAVMSLPMAALASSVWNYYNDVSSDGYWNLPDDTDQYVQGYDPADFSCSEAYTIVSVGIWASGGYTHADGSGPCMVYLILLPTKETSPEGIAHTYELSGQTLAWYADTDTLNEFAVNWPVAAGQCIGLGIIGEDPFIQDYVIPQSSGPSATADWEFYDGVWNSLEDDYGYDTDFCFQLTVADVDVQPTSVGHVKALYK
jgi:hypothetical protein